MSVQLVLYPQISLEQEILYDGIDFNTMDFASNYDTTTTNTSITNLYNSAGGSGANSWRRFRYTVNGTMALPDGTGGTCVLNTVTQSDSGGRSGIYQGLTGLTVGAYYTISVEYTTGTGYILLAHTNGTSTASTSWHSLANLSTTSTFSFNITAYSTTDTVFLMYFGYTADSVVIQSMSVVPYAGTTPGSQGEVICDLYEDEDIPLTLSVDNFKNIAEKIQSYSKDFNLPATKRNNKIFGSLFEITRSVGDSASFNPYITTRAVLKQNGLILFDGALKLIDIQDKEGEISYNVNLFAQTIALADTLKNKTFDNIDFDELQHRYDKTSIKASWYVGTGLPLTNPLPTGTYAGTAGASTTQVLKYPFVDWTGQILIANGSTGNNATPGNPELTSFEQSFRPFIQIKYLIDRIFSEAGYTYTSTLFSSANFANLYMDFNWGGDSMPSVIGDTSYTATYQYAAGTDTPFFNTDETFLTFGLIDSSINGGLITSSTPPDYVDTVGSGDRFKIVSSADNQLYKIDYNFMFFNDLFSSNDTFILKWLHYDASTTTTTTYNYSTVFIKHGDIEAIAGNLEVSLDTGDKLYAQYAGTGPYGGSWAEVARTPGGTASVTLTATFNISQTIVNSQTLNSKRGEINQWDFIKGIFTMFNLITLEDKNNPGNIMIETYSDVFSQIGAGSTLKDRGIKHDWTNKIDIKDIKLKPLNDLKKKTTFKYEEDEEDYMFNVYRRSTNGHLYGSKVFSAAGLTVLEGEDEIVASPFAATVSKPIGQSFTDMIIPTIYSVDDDGQPSGFNNKPRILYNSTGASPVTLTSSTYYIPAQNGTSSENSSTFFTFSHLSQIPTTSITEDYNFGECQLIAPIGSSVSSNLFNNNWLPYYNELYNPDTKVMVIKVNLHPGDIAAFEFSDMVMIKNRAYRVNRIDYKPKDLSTVEFILIS